MMTFYNDARSDEATSARAICNEADTKSPPGNDTTSQGTLASLLFSGAENGLKAREITLMTGWTAREIEAIAQQERRQGVPILSDTYHGYYLPASDEEKDAFVRVMRHRAGEILETAAAVERGGAL